MDELDEFDKLGEWFFTISFFFTSFCIFVDFDIMDKLDELENLFFSILLFCNFFRHPKLEPRKI